MAQTIYASFADASLAEKAAGALLDYGVRQEDLSLVANDQYGRARVTEGREVDRDAVDRNFRGDWSNAASNSTQSAGDRVAQAGDRTMAAASGAVGADNTAMNYDAAADERAAQADLRADEANADAGYRGGVAAPERPATVYPGNNYTGTANTGAVYTDTADNEAMDRSDLDTEDRGTESAAKHGISTTIGGAIAGGVTGYLKDQGVPDTVAANYSKDVENGGALLAVTVPSNNVDAGTAEQILGKYGATNVSSY